MTLALQFARVTCVSDSRFILTPRLTFARHYSNDTKPPPKSKAKSNVLLNRANVRKNVRSYMFSRFFDRVKNYDKVLEKNFPSAMQVYRMFFDGVKEFFLDMKRFLKVYRIVSDSPQGPRALNRKELELFMQMPRDMAKVAPTILLSSLPMVGYAAFPLAYMFPRALLTSHFWTLQQKSEYQQASLCERLYNNRPVLRFLQSKLNVVTDDRCFKELTVILGLLGSGFHPSVDQILDVKDIFKSPPYNYESLSSKHIKHLAYMHGIPGALFRRRRMAEHAFLIHYMDQAIMREGGIHNMPEESIRNSCYLRGLNPRNLSHNEMVEWLQLWTTVSLELKEEHMSLFLHLPIFLGYNHPNNWQLIYCKH